jgi:hypothetical protein
LTNITKSGFSCGKLLFAVLDEFGCEWYDRLNMEGEIQE